MAANNQPIYPLTPNIAMGSLTAANTGKDGTGTVLTLNTAGLNGMRLDKIRAKPLGTNVKSVARIFLNNGSTNATAGNNTFLGEIDLPAITNTETAYQSAAESASPGAQSPTEFLVGFPIPAGWKVLVVLGTAVSAGWQFTGIGGDY